VSESRAGTIRFGLPGFSFDNRFADRALPGRANRFIEIRR
jgi:hypothetical protein